MRIGLFGGTFNPVHRGHLQVAGEIKSAFSLERLYIIPAAQPPHKKASGVANAADRLEMVRRAFENLDGYVVSDVEIKRSGPSYTIDTFHYFRSVLPGDASLFLVLGLDAFLEIETWMFFQELLTLLPLIVMTRPGCRTEGLPERAAFEKYLFERISREYRFAMDQNCYVHPHNQPIHLSAVTPLEISATVVRECVKNGRSIRPLVPEAVADYINEKGLYA